MKHSLVLTAVGPDRPGLVDELTGFLLRRGANLADSRMVNLRGQFAVIMLVELSGESGIIESLQTDLPGVSQKIGLTVTLVPQEGSRGGPLPGVPFSLKVTAMDQPGIVHRVTHLLHQHGANVEDLTTELEEGAYTGTPLFTMHLRMTVPSKLPVRQLRQDLTTLCDELNCDFDLQPG
ncbi:MAG: hypothetical protein IT441_09780 [Phycisphaeraceae bacterium]|nr:hypothetical protein [Phycisphaeraceae bacterium]